MSMALKLAALADAEKPVRVGLIGAGKFGSMFLSQAPLTRGYPVLGIADLDVNRVCKLAERLGWPKSALRPNH
jgi:predicted homoserine dehydrogenase-like protein